MRFSLRSLLLAIAIIGIAVHGWREATKRQRNIDNLRRDDVIVSYVYPFLSRSDWRGSGYASRPVGKEPSFLNTLFGADFLSDGPVGVYVSHREIRVDDNDVSRIVTFRNLEMLSLVNRAPEGGFDRKGSPS